MCDDPLPSRSIATRISVSRVLRAISAVRSPARRNCQTRFQSSVISTQCSARPLSANIARPASTGCNKIPFAPRFRANSMSVVRSPMTSEFFQVVVSAEIFAEHPGQRFARRGVVGGHRTVDQDVVEANALAFERFEHQVVRRPERRFGETRRSQSVLVRGHRQARNRA